MTVSDLPSSIKTDERKGNLLYLKFFKKKNIGGLFCNYKDGRKDERTETEGEFFSFLVVLPRPKKSSRTYVTN